MHRSKYRLMKKSQKTSSTTQSIAPEVLALRGVIAEYNRLVDQTEASVGKSIYNTTLSDGKPRTPQRIKLKLIKGKDWIKFRDFVRVVAFTELQHMSREEFMHVRGKDINGLGECIRELEEWKPEYLDEVCDEVQQLLEMRNWSTN